MTVLSGRWKLGLLLACSTALMWGVLPLALKGLMTTLDPMTTTFFRFFIAALLLTPYLVIGKKLLNRHKFRNVFCRRFFVNYQLCPLYFWS